MPKKYVGKGLKSRKFCLTIIALLLITGMGVASFWFPAATGVLPTYCGGILGALGLYMGGNVGATYVAGKTDKGEK